MKLDQNTSPFLSFPPSPSLPFFPPIPSSAPLSLSSQGANTDLRCRWTNMNALHYAAFFDVPEIINILAKQNPGKLPLATKKTW